jgi:hypothetical protein
MENIGEWGKGKKKTKVIHGKCFKKCHGRDMTLN